MSFFGAGKKMIKEAISKLSGKPQQTLGQARVPGKPQGKKKAKQPLEARTYHGHPIHQLSPRIQRVLAEKERRRNS